MFFIAGPLLFLIYVNDLAEDLSDEMKLYIFADDVTLYTAQDS